MSTTTEYLIKILQKYPKDTKISVWQENNVKTNSCISITYCPETKEIILY